MLLGKPKIAAETVLVVSALAAGWNGLVYRNQAAMAGGQTGGVRSLVEDGRRQGGERIDGQERRYVARRPVARRVARRPVEAQPYVARRPVARHVARRPRIT